MAMLPTRRFERGAPTTSRSCTAERGRRATAREPTGSSRAATPSAHAALALSNEIEQTADVA